MSPLAVILMKVLRAACWAAAALLAGLICLHVWKVFFSSQAEAVAPRGDYVFTGIMAAMMVGAVWLALSIARELKNNARPPG